MAVSPQATLVVNPVVGCRYFSPDIQLLSQPKRSPRYVRPHNCHPRVWRGNTFSCVCLSVCRVRALRFESLHPETSFLVCGHIFRMSRSVSYIKVIGSRSRSQEQKACLSVLFAGGLLSTEEAALAKRSVKYLFSDLVLDVQL